MHNWGSRSARKLSAAALAVVVPVALFSLLSAAPASALQQTERMDAPSATVVAAVATATRAELPNTATAIERGHVEAALVEVQAAQDPTASAWTDVASTATPGGTDEFSVGFDNGQNVPSGLPESFGTRMAIVTVRDGSTGFVGSILTLEGVIVTCSLGHNVNSAADLLAGVGPDGACPSTGSSKRSAITSAWAWGNSVDPAVDNRGLGQSGMTPSAIAAFAHSHRLSTVFLSVPWAADQGAIATWAADCVQALHADGITVAALGGDSAWLAQPQLAAQWVSSALQAADFDAVELDVEPWSDNANPDFATITPQLTTMLDATRSAAGDLPIGIDLPWWLTERSYGSGTVFDAILAHADSVAIVAFADHAAGSDGIISLSRPAVTAATAAGIPFSIGVETDSPSVAGGAQFTFYDGGASVLATETAKVRAAFATEPGYRGVAAEHLLSWKALLAR